MKDGGPAFPNIGIESEPDETGNYRTYSYQEQPGMTLRDYFAAKAMQGILAGNYGETSEEPWDTDDYKKSVARVSYEFADAMLAERARYTRPEGT